MSEIEDLIGIYGAIDRAVVAQPELAEVVSPFIGAYAEGAAGWFDELTRWTEDRTGVSASDQYPSLEGALADLADIAPRGRMRARRLLAIAVALRVFPELRDGGDLAGLAARALAVEGLTTSDDAEAMVRLLTDDAVFASLGDWARLLDTAFEASLIPASTAMQGVAPPCSGRLVMVKLPGDTDPVPTLETHFCTDQLTLEQAKRFLEPVNWPTCHPLWCEMTPLGPSKAGNPTYREVVSVDCSKGDQVWRAETCLEFKMLNLPNGGALVTYDLCEGRPQPGDMILVDSGTLTVVPNGNQVCVHTTKRILFDHPFSGPSLAALICALGYGAAAEDLVFSCAMESGAEGTEFPGIDPPDTTGHPKGEPQVKKDEQTGDADVAKAVKDVIDEAVDATKQCIDECAAAYQTSYEKLMAGTYKADDAVADMTAMWTRLARDGATMIDLGLKASQAAARSRPRADGRG